MEIIGQTLAFNLQVHITLLLMPLGLVHRMARLIVISVTLSAVCRSGENC